MASTLTRTNDGVQAMDQPGRKKYHHKTNTGCATCVSVFTHLLELGEAADLISGLLDFEK